MISLTMILHFLIIFLIFLSSIFFSATRSDWCCRSIYYSAFSKSSFPFLVITTRPPQCLEIFFFSLFVWISQILLMTMTLLITRDSNDAELFPYEQISTTQLSSSMSTPSVLAWLFYHWHKWQFEFLKYLVLHWFFHEVFKSILKVTHSDYSIFTTIKQT